MKNLHFRGIEFLSAMDEESFFTWLRRIECVKDIRGDEDEIKISIAHQISDLDLREIIAITYRYNTDMSQLRDLLTDTNRTWFYENQESYWHDRIFGYLG